MSEMIEQKEQIIAPASLEKEENFSQSNEMTAQQQEKLDAMEQTVSKQKTKKKKVWSVLFFVFNLLVVAGILVYQFLSDPIKPFDDNIRVHGLSMLGVIAFLLGVVLCETFIFSYLLKISTGKWRFGLSYKVAEVGRYYDSVTPMASGGQAFQVSYLKSRGVASHNALSIPLAKYVFGQFAWVIISFVALVISWTDKSYGSFVGIASIIGFILSAIVLFATLFLSISKKLGKVLIVWGLKVLYKIKIIKDYNKQYEKITSYISDVQDVMKQYAKSPKDFIILTFFSILRHLFNYSIPFFVVHFFIPLPLGGEWLLKLIVMSILVDLSASFFPLPGGTGMNELSFTAAFGMVTSQYPDVPLVWVLLFWRFCSYYFYLLQGILILSYDIAYGNRKYRWQVVRNNLVEESAVFKQQQISRFKADRAKRRKTKNKIQL